MEGGAIVRLKRHCLRIENDLQGYQQLRWMVKMYGQATLMYNVTTRRLLALEGYQYGGGSFVFLGDYTEADLPRFSLQLIYDRLAEALEQRWELGWVNG